MTPIWTKEQGFSRDVRAYAVYGTAIGVVMALIKITGTPAPDAPLGETWISHMVLIPACILVALLAWAIVRTKDRFFGRR